jgi:hypothetical protein
MSYGYCTALRVLIFSFFLMAAHAQETDVEVTQPAPDLPAGALGLGYRGAEGFSEEQLDILMPIYMRGDSGLWLLNTRATLNDEDEEELNLGIVYRQLLGDRDAILGGNIYYDSRWSANNVQYDQLAACRTLINRPQL